MSIVRWNWLLCSGILALGVLSGRSWGGQETARRIHEGDTMPGFALADVHGKIFTSDPSQARVLGIVILKSGQEQFERIMADLKTVVDELGSEGKAFDCVGVMSGPGAREYLLAHPADVRRSLPVLLDPDFNLWGKLGIIAAPTAIVVGADRKVQWTEAGYGYDFIPAFRAHLRQALGLSDEADATVQVETLQNASSRARLERHVQMARALAQRGRLKPAIEELQRAQTLDPNATTVVLELGELQCRAGESEAALKTAATAEPNVKTDREKARVLLISGWARRQMGELDTAEALLSKAAALDPSAARTLYELGKVYQERGDMEKALDSYRKALARVFGEGEKVGLAQP